MRMSELAKGKQVMLLRKKMGLSQQDLADQSGVSLRSIQRLESGETTPQGFTLRAIAKVLGENVENLQNNAGFVVERPDQLKLINLSILCFLIIPFSNIVLPIIFYQRIKTNPIIGPVAGRIITFQIKWTLVTSLLLVSTPFIQYFIHSMGWVIKFPLILLVLFFTYLLNVMKTLKNAGYIQSQDYEYIFPSVKPLL